MNISIIFKQKMSTDQNIQKNIRLVKEQERLITELRALSSKYNSGEISKDTYEKLSSDLLMCMEIITAMMTEICN